MKSFTSTIFPRTGLFRRVRFTRPSVHLVLVNQPHAFASISSDVNASVMFVRVGPLKAATQNWLTLLRHLLRNINHF